MDSRVAALLRGEVEKKTPRRLIKVIVVGRSHCGKTSLVTRLVYDTYDDLYKQTIGTIWASKPIDHEVILDIWDTSGDERFQPTRHAFYRDVHAAIICYDDNEQVEKIEHMVNQLRIDTNDIDLKVPIIICRTKSDQGGDDNEDVVSYASDNYFTHVKTSAKDGSGVTELFEMIPHMVAE